MKKILLLLFATIGVIAFIGAIKFSQYTTKKNDPFAIQEHLSPQFSDVSGIAQKTVSVLFLGNSFTSTNDLPGMLIKIASSDQTNNVRLEVLSETKESGHLQDLWKDGEAAKLIQSRHFDYVVLQEQSSWALSDEGRSMASYAVGLWCEKIKSIGATPLFFETWSDKSGSPLYTNERSALYREDPDDVQKKISEQSKSLADLLGIRVIPVGDFWAYARHIPNMPDLYISDFHHPSPAGTYLTALLFYRYFTKRSLDQVTYKPDKLTTDQDSLLVTVASK